MYGWTLAEYAAPPYLPPSYFEAVEGRFLRPALEMIHAAGAVSRVHAHGKVGAILPQIAACGAMIAEPVEPPPDGDLPLCEAKRLYGDRLTIMGNIELKELEYASAERVRELVRETMRAGKPGGGFIFMPTATPINTPLAKRTEENLITMIEAALEYGAYGTESDR